MGKIKKLFGNFNMTWSRVLILSAAAAIYTAFVNIVPLFNDTSVQDIAVYLDWWFVFAIFIVVNCNKWWEASLKCFVFFLVSQPLIYLIEVPFSSLGWSLFGYYGYWAKITLLTLPGAAAAFLLKKKNWLSVLVLSVATGYFAYSCVMYFTMAVWNFPHHILSCICSVFLALFFIFILLDKKELRTAALILFVLILIIFVIISLISASDNTKTIDLGDGEWSYTVEDDSIVAVEIGQNNIAAVSPRKSGGTYVRFSNADGNEREYYVTVSGGGVWVYEFTD